MAWKDPEHKRKYEREWHRKNRQTPIDKVEGRKVIMRASLSAAMSGQLTRILNEGVATGRYPWKTMSAVIGGLLQLGMESLKDDPEMQSAVKYLKGLGQLEGMAAHRNEAQAAFNRAKVEIGEMLAVKADAEARRYFHDLRRTFAGMDTHVWQQWLLKQLDGSFPQLATRRPPRTSLDDHAEDEVPPYEKTEHKAARKKGRAR